MPKREAPLSQLQRFLPDSTFGPVMEYLQLYHIHLTIARERLSLLGDYRHRTQGYNHRISVNGNLNKYAFLITLLHEIAHLLAFEQHGSKIQSHGKEWKFIYGKLLEQFLGHKVFPADIEKELVSSLKNPAATSCAEDDLIRVLRKHDPPRNGYKLVEEIPLAGTFKTVDGKVFRKGERQRKRYKCVEVKSGKEYLFSPVYEVEVWKRS